MIRSFLSRYHPRYIRSLVYMLQASEYDVRDYLKWYHRTKDFTHVERRKSLVKTGKVLLLLGMAWIVLLLLYGAAIFLWWQSDALFASLLGLILLLLTPFLLAYLIVIPLGIIRFFIQLPVEYFLLRRTQQELATHKAVKIAIAGSFGKTSMREILKTVLSQGKKVAAPPESFNTPLGIRKFVNGLAGNEEVLIFELGEYYPGDVAALCRLVNPQWGVITGVNEAHLEKFKSVDAAAKTIFELADWLGAQPLYINGESNLAQKNARPGDLIYSRSGVGEWKVEDAKSDLTGTSFVLIKGNTTFQLHSGLLGLHQVGPLAAAVDIASRLGLSAQEIERGVAATKPFAHRLEPRTDQSGAVTLDDSYNGNPDGVKAVIEFLASLKDHRRFYVTPGLVEMGRRSEAIHREIGKQLAAAHIEKVVLIKNSVTSWVAEGLREVHYDGEIIWFDDGLSAFAALPHLTVKGDIVLLQNDWPDQYA
ncbi:MAG: UDP-N-acetylmuramoyl-tripeptide--D-alanyl-D-alanine ligase [Candidatus Sungbacteria bacterium]|nr:UDP-N-acetylmuramoyl-tripeptide--D-alanyl-D-alanine ligase [Candidatus Sungbacteria bacterium]